MLISTISHLTRIQALLDIIKESDLPMLRLASESNERLTGYLRHKLSGEAYSEPGVA